MLMDEGVIAVRRNDAAAETRITATKDATLFRGPLVVLANGFTGGPASAGRRDQGQCARRPG